MSGLLAGFIGGVAKGGLNIIDQQEQQAREEQQRKAVLGDRIALERELSGIRQDEAGTIAQRRADVDMQGRQRQVQAVDGRLEEGARSQWSQMAEAKRVETLAALRAEREAKGQPVDDAALAAEADKKLKVEEERQRLAFKRNPRNRAEAAMLEGLADPMELVKADNRTEVAQIGADARLAVAQAQAEVQNARTAAQMEIAQAKLGQAQARLEAQQARGHQSKAPSGYKWTKTGELEPIKGGPADPTVKGDGGRPMPTSAANGLLANQANLREAERALALVSGQELPGGVKGDKEATGWKNILPNQALNRLDPAGVETRAAISNLGSLVIHDRSGAAVTAAEFPRLAPFIPSSTDDPETARKKLGLFVQNYKALVSDQVAFFRESGYRVPVESLQSGPDAGGAPPRITSPAQLRDLPSGSTFTAPDGSIRRKP